MSISPFPIRSAPPPEPGQERRRARIVLAFAALGITAALLAYAVSPTVRHAVRHAAHSVKHAVSHVFDPDSPAHKKPQHPKSAALVRPVRATHRALGAAPSATGAASATATALPPA